MSDKFEYGSGFLYAEDLLIKGQFQTVRVEIEDAIPPGRIKAANGKVVDRWVLKFAGKDKLLALCDTNVRIVHLMTGDPPGPAWHGKAITLQVRVVEAFGDNVIAIRVVPPNGTPIRKALLKRLGTKAVYKADQ